MSIEEKNIGQIPYESSDQWESEADSNTQNDELKTGLASRHIQLIALGGTIGTGLFVSSGSILASSGPLGLLLGYLSLALVVYFVMNQIGEMVVFLPQNGAVVDLAKRYVDESLGFAAGWLYYYTYFIIICAELTAAAIVIEYWTTKVPTGAWIAIFLVVIALLNFLAVKFYGESEFWLASIKLICLFGLIIIGIVIFFGGGPNQHGVQGFKYWKHPGPFVNHLNLPNVNTGRFLDYWTSVIKAGFAFVSGPELIALTSAETINPRRNLRKATGRFVYRLLFFYIFGALIIGIMVPSNNPRLLSGGSDASASPFVIGIQNVGIHGLNHVINACILTSAWSAGNTFFYAASRFLYTMAKAGDAPKIFARVNRNGIPYVACLFTALISCLAFLNVADSGAKVFAWFSNLTAIGGFIGWAIVGICYLRFRKALIYNNLMDRLPMKTPFQPYGTYFTVSFIILILITNGYAVFFHFNGSDFVATYITLPVFFAAYFGHKIWTRNWKWAYPIEEIDVFTGLEEAEAEENQFIEIDNAMEKSRSKRIIDWLL